MGDTIVVRARDNYVALASGTRIGRYVVRSVLGQGSFGITYLAHDGQLGCDVAIKEYLPMALAVRHDGLIVVPNSTKVAEEFAFGRERFIEEGHTLAGFRGRPGMVHVYDLVEDHGTAYIVMELVHGSTLADELDQDGPLSAQDVDRLLPPLLDVLATVHQAGFVHRDIKPANILLDREGRPILIDFGAARAAMASRTSVMTAVFTPGYAAVEQFVEGNARAVDRHLRARSYILSRYFRPHAAKIRGTGAGGQVPTPGRAETRGLPGPASERHRPWACRTAGRQAAIHRAVARRPVFGTRSGCCASAV